MAFIPMVKEKIANSYFSNVLIRNWFAVKGRADRKEYICRFLIVWFVGCTRTFYSSIDGSIDYSKPNLIALMFILISILSVTQMFFVNHRRLHDLNVNGWWQLITITPFGIILIIGFIFKKGTQSPNKYGEEPKY